MTRKLGLNFKKQDIIKGFTIAICVHVSQGDDMCRCFITVVPLYAWVFVLEAHSAGQCCWPVLTELSCAHVLYTVHVLESVRLVF